MKSHTLAANDEDAGTSDRLTLDLADRLELGSRLRRLREGTGLTTLQVAEQVLGYKGSHAAVSRLERGVFATINLSHLDTLAAFYGTTREALLGGTEGSDTSPPPEVEGDWGSADIAPGVHERLRDLRQALGLTRRDFCRHMGNGGFSHYAMVERGEVLPRPDVLLKVATTFGVSGSWLILGKKARIKQPTQALRLRSLRQLKGLSRPALAIQAAPEQFKETHASVALSEARGLTIPWEQLQKLAKAFDVPPEFLDPQEKSRRAAGVPAEGEVSPDQALFRVEQLLPKSAQKLLEQIRTTAAMGLLEAEDTAWLLKELSNRTWRRTRKAA